MINKERNKENEIYGNPDGREATIEYCDSTFFRYSVNEPGRIDPTRHETSRKLAMHILSHPEFRYTSENPTIRKEISRAIEERLQQTKKQIPQLVS